MAIPQRLSAGRFLISLSINNEQYNFNQHLFRQTNNKSPAFANALTLYASSRQLHNYKVIMTLKSWTFYLLILLIGSFLYLSIIFSYGLSAPFHILIIWLMYDRFLSTIKSDLNVSKTMVSVIPCVGQNLLFFIYFILTGDLTISALNDFYFSWIGLVLIFVTVIELIILRSTYSKFQRKHIVRRSGE